MLSRVGGRYWGAAEGHDTAYLGRSAATVCSVGMHALAVTKHGHPRHPLYIRGSAPLVERTPPGR
jgi:hypothetical protein